MAELVARIQQFRLLLYMVNIWDRQRRKWLDQKRPVSQWRFLPIIPIVFYTGSQTWDTPLSLAALKDLPEELAHFIPHFDSLLLKLKQTPPEELTARGHPFGWLLRAIQKEGSSERELQQALEEAVVNLEGLAEQDQRTCEVGQDFTPAYRPALPGLLPRRPDPQAHGRRPSGKECAPG